MTTREREETEDTDNKRPRVSGDDDVDEDICIVCMRSRDELLAADTPMTDQHSCSQCNKSSWSICEECEEHHLSRKCPVCRGQYAPVVLHEFPDINPDLCSSQLNIEAKLFQAKMALLIKLLCGSNTALYLPEQDVLRFFLPQDFDATDQESKFIQIDITGAHEKIVDGRFEFTDKIWDELEDAQGVLDEGANAAHPVDEAQDVGVPQTNQNNTAADATLNNTVESAPEATRDNSSPTNSYTYTPINLDDCPTEYSRRVNETFLDTAEDIRFKVIAVCSCSGRTEHFFKFYNTTKYPDGAPEDPDECEYTPCREILSADYVAWDADHVDWVLCVACSKWRQLPKRNSPLYPTSLPDDWQCNMNTWDDKNSCETPEDPYDDAPVANTAPQTDGPPNDSIDSEGMLDLCEVCRRITRELRNTPGAKYFTRLAPDIVHDIIRVAMTRGQADQQSECRLVI